MKTNFLKFAAVFSLVLLIAAGCSKKADDSSNQQQSPANQSAPADTAKTNPAPASDPHADWKTYADSSAGFSFSYPKFFVESRDADLVKFDAGDKGAMVLSYGGAEFVPTPSDEHSILVKTIDVGSIKFYLYSGAGGCEGTVAIANYKAHTLSIDYGGCGKIDETLLDQVVKTFQFTK